MIISLVWPGQFWVVYFARVIVTAPPFSLMGLSHSIYVAPQANYKLFNLYLFSLIFFGKTPSTEQVFKKYWLLSLLFFFLCSLCGSLEGEGRILLLFCGSSGKELLESILHKTLIWQSVHLWFRLARQLEFFYLMALVSGREDLSFAPVGHLGTDSIVSQAGADPALCQAMDFSGYQCFASTWKSWAVALACPLQSSMTRWCRVQGMMQTSRWWGKEGNCKENGKR